MIKVLWLCLLPVAGTAGAFAAAKDSSAYNVIWLPQSNVEIRGYTNLNSFTCTYCGELPRTAGYVHGRTMGNVYELNPGHTRLRLPVSDFDCGIPAMNKDLRELLNAGTYPEIELGFTTISRLQTGQYTVDATLTIAGNTREVCIPVSVSPATDGVVHASGILYVHLRDYGIEPPVRLMGMIRVKDTIEVSMDLYLLLQ